MPLSSDLLLSWRYFRHITSSLSVCVFMRENTGDMTMPIAKSQLNDAAHSAHIVVYSCRKGWCIVCIARCLVEHCIIIIIVIMCVWCVVRCGQTGALWNVSKVDCIRNIVTHAWRWQIAVLAPASETQSESQIIIICTLHAWQIKLWLSVATSSGYL